MLVLGEFEGYTLTVNRSNVMPNMVTYHLFKDGEDKAHCREECDQANQMPRR